MLKLFKYNNRGEFLKDINEKYLSNLKNIKWIKVYVPGSETEKWDMSNVGDGKIAIEQIDEGRPVITFAVPVDYETTIYTDGLTKHKNVSLPTFNPITKSFEMREFIKYTITLGSYANVVALSETGKVMINSLHIGSWLLDDSRTIEFLDRQSRRIIEQVA